MVSAVRLQTEERGRYIFNRQRSKGLPLKLLNRILLQWQQFEHCVKVARNPDTALVSKPIIDAKPGSSSFTQNSETESKKMA